jgi:hypothetical protein
MEDAKGLLLKENTSSKQYQNIIKNIVWILLIGMMLFSIFFDVLAIPSGPVITYVSNTTSVNAVPNRSQDAKGTITTVTMVANQQDYKWKAYVGNISGSLALDDVNGKSIYDWAMGSPTGEVYATRYSGSVNWANVSCINQGNVNTEETALGMGLGIIDNINGTFKNITHKSFLVGTKNITADSCKSTATYINDAAQSLSDNLIYTTMIENSHTGYDGQNYNFQMLVAENESATIPLTYYFYVELG